MTQDDLRVVEQLKNRLSNIVPIIDFRIFGSRARGDASQDSDMDVFLEVESLDREVRAQGSDADLPQPHTDRIYGDPEYSWDEYIQT
jgi:predicted nucleotidyltransferase